MTETRQVLEIRHKFVSFGMAGFRCLNEDILQIQNNLAPIAALEPRHLFCGMPVALCITGFAERGPTALLPGIPAASRPRSISPTSQLNKSEEKSYESRSFPRPGTCDGRPQGRSGWNPGLQP